jgi:hypothetical protein
MENLDPDDPVATYILEASKVEPLTKAEEANLFREMEKWDIGAVGTNKGKTLRGD